MPLPLANLAEQAPAVPQAHVPALNAPRVLELWHLASLDAPTVAIVWSLAFAWAAGIALPFWVPVLLALGTWSVYIGDRLLDARSGMVAGSLDQLRERHFFHWRHRRTLVPLALGAAAVAATMIFTLMPAPNREHNSVLAAIALAYFSGVHGPRRVPRWLQKILTKELLVGVLFTAGCAAPTLSRLGKGSFFHPQLGLPLVLLLSALAYFSVIAWLNCHAIDRWEQRAEKSLSGMAGAVLAIAGVVAAALVAHSELRVAMLLFTGAVIAALLSLLHMARARITPLALRTAADLVLLAPIVLVIR